MLPKTVITALAAAVLVVGAALLPTSASAQRGHGPGGFHPGGGFAPGGGGFHPGGFARAPISGFRGVPYRGYRYWGVGVYPWWGYEYPWWGYEYPWPYYYGPTCGYVHVKYYRHHRAYWRWVYRCE